jgi:hypothetical protein
MNHPNVLKLYGFFHDSNVTTKIKASVINSGSHMSLKFIYKDENQFNKEEITGLSNLKNPI